jgi:hypothetical protein
MKIIFKDGPQQVKRNFDIGLQFIVTVLRPIFFTVLVTSLRNEESLKYLIYAIGFIGFFAILDLIVQSYIRSRHLSSSGNINLKGIFSIAAIFLIFLSWYAPAIEPLVYLLALIYCINSLLFLYEYDLAQKKCIVFTYSSELLLACLCVSLIYVGFRHEALIFIAFASYPIGRILGLIIYRFYSFLSADSSSTKVELPSPSKKMRSSTYMTYCIAQASFGAVAGSLPVIFFSVLNDYNLYTVALVYMRWFHAGGALLSTVINVLGARIFYRTMNINLFVKNGHWLAENEAKIKWLILVSFVLLLGLLIYSNEINLLVMTISVFVLAVMNYFSSLLNAFARPDLALICHSIVLGLSCHVCSVIFNISFIGLFALALSFSMFVYIYSFLMDEFRNLTA